MEKQKKRVIIIGAGASGLVAATQAAKRGLDVTIIEANPIAGKKLYATGSGKCNLTNENMDISFFRSGNEELVKSVLERFGTKETLAYFNDLGLILKNKNGYFYPASGQASGVVRVLELECERCGVNIVYSQPVTDVYYSGDCFAVSSEKRTYACDGLILSCGSLAGISKKNSLKVNGYDLAKSFGHKMVPIVSALTGLKCENTGFYKAVSGVRCDAEVKVYSKDKLLGSDSGELQLTDYGISGIPVFQISRFAAYSVRECRDTYCCIDFMPFLDKKGLMEMLFEKCRKFKDNTIEQYFAGILNDRLACALIAYAGLEPDVKGMYLTERDIGRMAETVKGFKDRVKAPRNFSCSQALAGGIYLTEVDYNMASIYNKNLYLTGELLDVDAMCGGYNLQWAWATGFIAGNSVLKNGGLDD